MIVMCEWSFLFVFMTRYEAVIYDFSEIFPYLVIIIGLENILVVTKSVVSTPVHLDVKLRVAQGESQTV